MSFILDALRRAEDGRQPAAASTPAIEAVPVPPPPPNQRRRFVWLAGAVGLVAVALAAASLFDRPPGPVAGAAPGTSDTAPAPARRDVTELTAATAVQAAPATARKEPVRALFVESRRTDPADLSSSVPPPVAKRRGGTVTVMPANPADAPAPVSVSAERGASPPADDAYAGLPEYRNSLLNGEVDVANLRLDMHVYNRNPDKRFVFINLRKYREGDRVEGKMYIEAIIPAGAVLNSKGTSFLLKPD